eukprot:6884177-Karenia_brevis.AAC.1
MSPIGNDETGHGDMSPESNKSEPNRGYTKTLMTNMATYTLHEQIPSFNPNSSHELENEEPHCSGHKFGICPLVADCIH